jgi:chromosome segregation ATPase
MTMTFEELQIIAERALILSERNTQSISRLETSLEETNKSLSRVESVVEETNKSLSRLESVVEETNKSLSRVEAIAESNARAIEATANKLDEKFDQIANAVIRDQDMIRKLDRRYRKQQAEIKGLRLETRRILERWLGEPFPDDPDLNDPDLNDDEPE